MIAYIAGRISSIPVASKPSDVILDKPRVQGDIQ